MDTEDAVTPGEVPADLPPTGDGRVDEAVAVLGRLAGKPPEEHVAVLEEVHGRLRDILGEIIESPPERGAWGDGESPHERGEPGGTGGGNPPYRGTAGGRPSRDNPSRDNPSRDNPSRDNPSRDNRDQG